MITVSALSASGLKFEIWNLRFPGYEIITLTVLVFGPQSISYERSRCEHRTKLHEIPACAFFENIKNLKQINCFSNEGNKWRNSKISFINDNTLTVDISEKFIGERGRINCSLKEANGFWRWLGVQFVIAENG